MSQRQAKYKTTAAFPEPEYTQTPNKFFDTLPDMYDSEVRVTLVMIRQTFGFHRDGFKMGVGKLADAAGLSRQGALDGAQAAEKRGTFRRTNPNEITEAEWELVVTLYSVDTPSSQLIPPLYSVEGSPQVGRGQVGVKEILKKDSKDLRGGLTEKEVQQANAQVDAMIANSRKVKYLNRDKIPEPYLVFADLYNELTKQEPTKRSIQEWFMTFEEWKAERLQPEHIRAAWQYANRPEGGFPVGRPGALTNTAVAMKSKSLAQSNQPTRDPYESLYNYLDQKEAQ